MAESLRDLVVSLSLDTTNFTKNIRSINTQIKAVEADFKAMGAGITNYQQTIDGAGKKVEMLNQVWLKQTQIVEQNQKALAEAQETLARKQAEYDAALKNTGAKDYAEKVDKCRNALLNAENAVNRAVTSTSNAKTALAGTNAQIEEARRELELVKNGWYDSATAIEKSEHSLNILGYDLQKVTSDYEAYVAGIKDAEKSEDALAAKRDRLASTVDILNKKYAEQNKQLEEYKKQLEAAKAAEDPQKIKEAETNIARTEAALAATNATLQKTSAELAQVNKDLDGHVLKWKNAGEAVTTFGDKMTKRGKTMTKVGKTLTTSITTPLVAMGTYSGKAYIEFEDAMAGVRKTVDVTDERFEELEGSVRQMALVTPTAANEIAFVMETAGQLGIGADAIEEFTKRMVDFGNVSNSLDAGTAAEQFARYANIRGVDQTNDYFDRLTSTVFKLSNTMATTEADVTEMTMNLAAAGTQVGMTDAQIVALAASLSSVGVSAAKGGTAFSKVLIKMESAVAEGVGKSNKALSDFASVAGMTQEEFAQLWETNSGAAFMAFIGGLAKMDEEGESSIVTLNEMGLKEVRLRDTMLRSVNAQELFADAMASANDEWENANYMSEKVEERYSSTANQIEILKNNATDLAISVGEILLPYVNEFIGMARDFVNQLKGMSKEELTAKLKMAAFAAAIGPAIVALGKLSQGIGFVSKGLGGFLTNVGKAGGGLKGLGTTLAKSPGLWMALAAAVAYAGYKFVDWVTGAKAAREALEDLDGTVREWEQNTTTAFEESGGLSALNLSKDAFGLDSFSANANEWLTNLIEVWTDGKKETDEIVQGMVDSWVEGSDKIREAEGITEEDKKALDDIDKEIESILKKRQNGYLTDKDKERLDELIGERDSIAIHYHLVEDVDSGFDDIVTNVEAALARGADPNKVWADAFKAAGEGYGTYMADLNKEFDSKYAEIMDSDLTDEEKANKVDELRTWYIEQKTAALQEYNAALRETAELTGGAESTKYDDTIEKLGQAAQLMRGAAGKSDTDPAVIQFANSLQELDESKIVELMTMIKSFEDADIPLPENLQLAKKYITELMGGAETYDRMNLPGDVIERFKKMFGKENLEGEVADVFSNMGVNMDDLTLNTSTLTIDAASATASASEVTVDGEAAVNGYLVGVSAETGNTIMVTKKDGKTPFQIGVDGYLERVNENGQTVYTQDGADVESIVVDVDGNLKAVKADGTVWDVKDNEGNPINAQVDGVLANVYKKANGEYTVYSMAGSKQVFKVPLTGVVEEIEMGPNPKFKFTNSPDPDLSYDAGLNLLTGGDDFITKSDELWDNLSSYFWEEGIKKFWNPDTQGTVANNKLKGSFKDLFRDNLLDEFKDALDEEKEKATDYSFPESLFHDKYDAFPDWLGSIDATEWQTVAQNIADGFQLIADGEMTPEEIEQFKEMAGIIFDLVSMDTPGGAMAKDALNDALIGAGFEEGAAGFIEKFETLGDDYAAGTGKGMADHDFTDDAETMVDNALESSREAGDAHSPARKFIPVGEDFAAGVAEGMESYNASGAANSLTQTIKRALEGQRTSFRSVGMNMMDGIVSGVNSRTGALALALIAAVKAAKKAVEDDNGIHSPSKLWRDDIGVNLAKGIGEGVMQEAPAQGKVIANAARYLKDSAAGAMSGGHSSIAGNDVTTNNNVSSNITVNVTGSWSVRSDKDIRKLAQQIARLTARVNYGYGMMNQMKKA